MSWWIHTMTYNDLEYAIVVARGMGLRDGIHALQYIKDNFNIEPSLSTYWRALLRVDQSTFKELEYITENKVQKHIQRIKYFERLKFIGLAALEEQEDPAKKMRQIIQLAELEKYIAQLESMTAKYFEKALNEANKKPKDTPNLELIPIQ